MTSPKELWLGTLRAAAGCGCASELCATDSLDARTNAPIACTLAPADYRARIAAIQNLARCSLRGIRRGDLSLSLSYAPDAADQVHAMVEQEKACCAFLTFAQREDAAGIHVTITAPETARGSAELLFAEFVPPDLGLGAGRSLEKESA